MENSWTSLDRVFLVSQSGDKGASEPIFPTHKTSKWSANLENARLNDADLAFTDLSEANLTDLLGRDKPDGHQPARGYPRRHHHARRGNFEDWNKSGWRNWNKGGRHKERNERTAEEDGENSGP